MVVVASGLLLSSPSWLLLVADIAVPGLVDDELRLTLSRRPAIPAFNAPRAVLNQPSTLLCFHKSVTWLSFDIHLTQRKPDTSSIC